jgi:SAM-dependent methyltransferase
MKNAADTWLSFWDQPHSIYVNPRHLDAHYRDIATGIVALLPDPSVRVLDYGCGEALHADLVAVAAAELVLCDGAPNVQAHLVQRFAGHPRIKVLSPAEVDQRQAQSIDVVVANSLVQYITLAELDALLVAWRRLLAPGGIIVLADVIPRGTGAMSDIVALLLYAQKRGFFFAAIFGLLKIAVSPYRKVRQQIGVTQYSEPEFLQKLAANGFAAERLHFNLEHNPARMTFRAVPTGPAENVTPATLSSPAKKT